MAFLRRWLRWAALGILDVSSTYRMNGVAKCSRPALQTPCFFCAQRLVSTATLNSQAGPCGPAGARAAPTPLIMEDVRMGSMSVWHWIIVLAVGLLLFGGRGKISDLMGDFAKG